MIVRRLDDGDISKTKRFLDGHIETSMFLRSNLEKVGFGYHGEPFEGEHLGAFDNGQMVGVIAHLWNGNLMMQAPDLNVLSVLYTELLTYMKRPLKAVVGNAGQARYILEQTGLEEDQFTINRNEDLFSLDLNDLITPNINDSTAKLVDIEQKHFDIVVGWLRNYEKEALGSNDNNIATDNAIRKFHERCINNNGWMLEIDGLPVALSAFNAQLPDIVQIGSVWTPPAHRNKGYARHLVARTLERARSRGVQKSILFTQLPAARKAYEAIGFQKIGEFRLSLLKEPVSISG